RVLFRSKPFISSIKKRPLFMKVKKELSSAEKGTAMHAVMQYLPFDQKLTKQEIKKYVDEMVEKSLILLEAAMTIDIEAIERFFQTDLAKKMLESTNLEKEIPFMFTQKASVIYQDWQ